MQTAFETAGVLFIYDDGSAGFGVRLAKKKENSWFHYNKYLASVKIACSPTMKRGGLRPISPSCGAGEAVDFLLFDGVNDRLGGNNYLWHSSILVAVNYKSQLAVEPDVFDESHLV
jgi:hypothetical protein